MNIQIRYFGMIAEATRVDREEVVVDQPVTVAGLREHLQKRHPSLREMDYRIAVNQELADPGDPIGPGYEIAFLPPFSGG